MSRIEVVVYLQQIFEKFKVLTTKLENDIGELTKYIEAEEFIPYILGESIIDKLSEISNVQKDIENQFSLLNKGEVPEKISEFNNLLNECKRSVENRGKYMKAVDYFMKLQTDDKDTQALLNKRKMQLISLDFEEMDEETLRDVAEDYVCLFNAYNETDPSKKFLNLYKLAGKFEEAIALGIHLNTLRVVEEDNLIDNLVEDKEESPEERKGEIEKNIESIKGAIEDTDIIGDQQKSIWRLIGIDNPSEVIFKEDGSLLEIELSPKASDKFGVKEFKRDITKQVPIEKLTCLVEALENCGYSKESIALWKNDKKDSYGYASDKLMQLGYLKKYIVKGFGEFFTLSTRGQRAFMLKDSLAFINSQLPRKTSGKIGGEHIEDSANAAINRILFNSCFSRTLKINEEYQFRTRINCIGTDYFFTKFPNVLEEKMIVYMGITSEKQEEFKAVYDYILENSEEIGQYVIIGVTHEIAAAISKWVLKITEGKISIWYCGITDTEIFDAETSMLVAMKQSVQIVAEDVTDEHLIMQQEEWTDIDEVVEKKEDIYNKELENVTEVKENVDTLPKRIEAENTLMMTSAVANVISEEDKKKHNDEYQKMLILGKFYCATAYLKALAKDISYYENVYRQLAYALNDPMGNCCYNSDAIFTVYYNNDNLVSEYFVVSATIRNYFYDHFSYDYSLQQLQAMVSGSEILREFPDVGEIIYVLQKFKSENNRGLDRYADYREKGNASWEIRLDEIKREAKGYYENYCVGNLKENASHKRFIETGKLLMGANSELSEYLQFVIQDERDVLDMLKEFLAENYVKENAEICEENIEPAKINAILDRYWDLAAQNMRLVKKTSDLMSSLRMNLFKRVHKIVSVLCNYVFLIEAAIPNKDDPALKEYKKLRKKLVEDINKSINKLSEESKQNLSNLAGKAVLFETLREIKARIEGNFKEGSYKYFYIDFLKGNKVILDDTFIPVLDEVLELPEFSICKRIQQHCQDSDKEWENRLDEIFNGEDDYGSAELILNYLESQNIQLVCEKYQLTSIEKAIVFPQKDLENKRREFMEDLELAQSYGQIDNTIENIKETMIQIMENWYVWAKETKNYGFFAKILAAFKEKIHKDAETRATELESSLEVYVEKNQNWNQENITISAVNQIKERIKQQNYAAAEDLLNRLLTNDLELENDFQESDYLFEFFNEYDVNYRKTANSGTTLKALMYTSKINKDAKGANRLLESWPRGARVSENSLQTFLSALGFMPDTIKREPLIQGKIESYLVNLKRPMNGRKSNYKHPISAFGSEAEDKGFRVACIFGKSDASRLIDTFREIGNAKNTIILLDYALTIADRRTLARKTKTDLTGKIFAVIDRVVLVYLANHYHETAINRMLMSVIMPFASYQPYINKSADVMPQEIFIGRKNELEKIESPTGVNIVYGGRQLGKTALLRMAKKDIDMNENGDRAIIVNAWKQDYRGTARAISKALYDEGIVKRENVTEDWDELARDIEKRLREQSNPIPYLLLMIDEADMFIESCEEIDYKPFNALKEIQSIGNGRFKFVVAGLRNIVRFKRNAALSNNGVLTHLESLTVKPFKTLEARELLEVPLSYLGFRFPKDNETEVLISTIFGTTNYFPGLIQLYCAKLIEAMKRDYAGYTESDTPPYYVQKELIKKVLAEQSLQQDIREKFFITLKVGDDDYYYIIALLVAYHYHENKSQNGCNAMELLEIADNFSIKKIVLMGVEKTDALMQEMQELNVLQHTGEGRYRFTRHSFCQMMGTVQQIDDELLNYMEE